MAAHFEISENSDFSQKEGQSSPPREERFVGQDLVNFRDSWKSDGFEDSSTNS